MSEYHERSYAPPSFHKRDVGKEILDSVVELNALDRQPGGNHYKQFVIQPIEFIHKNGLGKLQGDVIKYVCRFRDKNGAEDLDKAIHCLQLLKELEYNDS